MLTRRGFVKLVGGTTALASFGFGCGDNLELTRGVFFDEHAWATIDIATGLLLPGADGARDCVAVRYIDTLLSAFDSPIPAIFAAGPYSGRTPFPDDHGQPTKTFPTNDFARYLPLPRLQELAWRIRIFGSAATAGGDFNDAMLGATKGWRDLYTAGVAQLDVVAMTLEANTPFRFLLDPANQELALDTVASDLPEFYRALTDHTIEGTFAAPEYGGNDTLRGWRLAKYDGDSAPRGHAVYDASLDAYIDRSDQPTTQPSPGAVSEDFSDDVIALLTISALGTGGKRFF